jgi:hypothetical protein
LFKTLSASNANRWVMQCLPLFIAEPLGLAKGSLEESFVYGDLVSSVQLSYHLSGLLSPRKRRRQQEVPITWINRLSSRLSLSQACFIQGNVAGSLKSSFNIPIGLTVAKQPENSFNH